jgi:hypothetical protein
LPAIISVSKCKLVCTSDEKSLALLKDRRCYPKRVERPRVYCQMRNADLLCDQNIADICKPKSRLSAEQRAALEQGVGGPN